MLDKIFGKIFGKKQESMPVSADLGALDDGQLKLYLRQYGCLTSRQADQIQSHNLYAAARAIQDHTINKRLTTGNANYLPTLGDIYKDSVDAEIDEINKAPEKASESISEEVVKIFDSWKPELNLCDKEDREAGEDSGIFEACKSKPTNEGKQVDSGSVNAPESNNADALFADARTFLGTNPEVATDPNRYATAHNFLSRESTGGANDATSFMDESGEEIIVVEDNNCELPSGIGETVYLNPVEVSAEQVQPAVGRRFYTKAGLVLPAAAVFTALSLVGSLLSGSAKPKTPDYAAKQAPESKETKQAQQPRTSSKETLPAEAFSLPRRNYVQTEKPAAVTSLGKIVLETIDREDPCDVHKWATLLHEMDPVDYREGQPVEPTNSKILRDGGQEYFIFDIENSEIAGVKLLGSGLKTLPLGVSKPGTYYHIRRPGHLEIEEFKIIPLTKGEQK